MKKFFENWGMVITGGVAGLAVAVTVARCGSASSGAVHYQQIEQLARPALNEALVTQNADLLTYNAGMPYGDLTSPLGTALVADIGNTLGVLYTAATLPTAGGGLNVPGAAMIHTASYTPKYPSQLPASPDATKLKADIADYAAAIQLMFIPDVMRIDTSQTSSYADTTHLCGPASKVKAGGTTLPGSYLCTGRWLTDDVITASLSLLLTGLQSTIPTGVSYAGTGNTNGQQGHTPITAGSATFPYLATPN